MEISGSVVVVTGASSGIGRALALELARRGAHVVVAARRAGALEDLVGECRAAGGDALAVPTDVTDAAAVSELARTAIGWRGRVDAWVNNAGVYTIGRLEQTPIDVFRRTLDVNVMGYVHGAHAIVPHFQSRRCGIVVMVASTDAHLPAPWASAYVASKFAVRGLAESLRQELRHVRDVHVAVVSPAAVDTPLWQHAANYSGRELKAVRPTYPPGDVVRAIVRQLEHPRRERIVGAMGRWSVRQRRLAPALADRAFALLMDRDQFTGRPASPTDGNLFAPLPGTSAEGGWRRGSPVAAVSERAAPAPSRP